MSVSLIRWPPERPLCSYSRRRLRCMLSLRFVPQLPSRVRSRMGSPIPSSAAQSLSTRASTRATLLERIRRQGDDPAKAFLPEDPASPTELLVPELDPRDVDSILASILLGMERDDTDRILAVLNEIQPLNTESVSSNFGAVDELFHASTDLYSDPVKALAKRPNLRLDRVEAADFDYPIVINRKVKNWMVYLLTRGRKYFVKWLARAERYEPLIVPRLEAAGLPRDLLYQAMIESGFNPYATSHASAVGVWQFIASTGRAYGLDRDWWIDERRDPVQATDSAIQFMSELYARFGTWEVASAAYNAGGKAQQGDPDVREPRLLGPRIQ